jgi:iron complex transport system ATP-binding protein
MLLAQDAEIFLLDEPTAFLDIRAQTEVLDILSSLRRSGKTVVAALHDLQQAFSFADRLVLLDGGRIAFEGPPDCPAAADGVRRVFGVSVRRAEEGSLFRYALARAEDAGGPPGEQDRPRTADHAMDHALTEQP